MCKGSAAAFLSEMILNTAFPCNMPHVKHLNAIGIMISEFADAAVRDVGPYSSFIRLENAAKLICMLNSSAIKSSSESEGFSVTDICVRHLQ